MLLQERRSGQILRQEEILQHAIVTPSRARRERRQGSPHVDSANGADALHSQTSSDGRLERLTKYDGWPMPETGMENAHGS